MRLLIPHTSPTKVQQNTPFNLVSHLSVDFCSTITAINKEVTGWYYVKQIICCRLYYGYRVCKCDIIDTYILGRGSQDLNLGRTRFIWDHRAGYPEIGQREILPNVPALGSPNNMTWNIIWGDGNIGWLIHFWLVYVRWSTDYSISPRFLHNARTPKNVSPLWPRYLGQFPGMSLD